MHSRRRRAQRAVVAAAAVLFLVVQLLSSVDEYDPTRHSRRLADDGRPRAHKLKDRVINDLMKQGIRSGDPNYRRLMKTRLHRLAKRNEKAKTERKMVRKLRNKADIWFRQDKSEQTELKQKHAQKRQLNIENGELDLENLEPLSICGRHTMMGTPSDLALLQKYNEENSCPGANSNKLLLLNSRGGPRIYGRTGNNLIEFLHALQFARDNDILLGIMSDSWAFEVIFRMWMSIRDDNWEEQFEKAFCVKIFYSQDEVEGYELVFPELKDNNHELTMQLFRYETEDSVVDYVGYQSKLLQTLFRNYNTGEGTTESGEPVKDMCSGIKALFGDKNNAIYSVIHSRTFNSSPQERDTGLNLLARISRTSGSDPEAALNLEPNYIKSILRPLGLLNYPIVLITDGQDFTVLQRLLNDPEIAPKLRLVPEEATWVGGDITLAIMSNVFIGNPASSFSGFIAKSRLALGLGQSYLFRAKNEKGEWQTVCGDTCVYDKNIMGAMS